MNRSASLIVPALLLALTLPCAARADAARLASTKPPAKVATPKRTPAPTAPEMRREPKVVGRTTIAPFPVPGDSSKASTERLKIMNVPREGITTITPLPPPAGEPHVIGEAQGGSARTAPLAPPPAQYWSPQPLYAPAPEYPEAAHKAGIQGTVLVQIHVLEDGSVGEATVTRSIQALDAVALTCARQMKFAPPPLRDKPSATWLTVPVRFTLH